MLYRPEKMTQTLERGLELLLTFSEEQPLLSVSEIATQTRLPVSTVYRLIQTLEAKGFVAAAGVGRYQLGASVVGMIRVVRRRFDRGIGGLSLPFMEELTAQIGETTLLTVVSGVQAVCIESTESRQAIQLSFQRGRVMPLWAGASAKVLLAYLDPQTQARVLEQLDDQRYANGEQVDPRALRRQLDTICAQGYAFTDSEVDPGVHAVAVPVLDSRGRLLAGLSIAGPSDRLPSQHIPALAAQLRDTAGQIGDQAELSL
jgi:DNA-binding IclR family transcriptional regulator